MFGMGGGCVWSPTNKGRCRLGATCTSPRPLIGGFLDVTVPEISALVKESGLFSKVYICCAPWDLCE